MARGQDVCLVECTILRVKYHTHTKILCLHFQSTLKIIYKMKSSLCAEIKIVVYFCKCHQQFRRGIFFICWITLHQLQYLRSGIAKKKKKKKKKLHGPFLLKNCTQFTAL